MIKVEGYKAFKGKMEIVLHSGSTIELDGDFLYKPDTQCWYYKGHSYPERHCKVILDRTEEF